MRSSRQVDLHEDLDVHSYYKNAKQSVLATGGGPEIYWQLTRDAKRFTEQDLLREAAWVILCSGFRERVVRRKFDYISMCYGDWQSASHISSNADICVSTAYHAFANRSKLRAIAHIACHVFSVGFAHVQAHLLRDPYRYLVGFPYIGAVTSRHLLKNLGFPIPKPDRHLVRIASRLGYSSVDQLCAEISAKTGDPIHVVDLVLWRHSAGPSYT